MNAKFIAETPQGAEPIPLAVPLIQPMFRQVVRDKLYPVIVAFMPEKEISGYDFQIGSTSHQGKPFQQRSPYRVQRSVERLSSTESTISIQNSSDQLAWPQWKWQA